MKKNVMFVICIFLLGGATFSYSAESDLMSNFLKMFHHSELPNVKELVSALERRSDLEAVEYVREIIKKAVNSNNRQQFSKIGTLFSSALYQHPHNQYIQYGYAYLDYYYERYKESNEMALKIYEKYPNFPHLTRLISENYREQEQCIEAISFGNEAITELEKLEPSMVNHVYDNLAGCYKAMKEYGKAEEYYLKSIELDPRHPFAYQNLGIMYQELEQWDDAIEYGEKSIALQSYPAAHMALGKAYFRNEKYQKAAEQYQIVLNDNPSYTSLWIDLGNAYMRMKQYDDAQKAYHQALKINSKLTSAHSGLGWFYIESKNYDEAVKHLEKALELDASNYFAIGKLKMVKAIKSGQFKDFENYMESDQKAKDLLMEAHVFMSNGEIKQAIELLTKAIEMNPFEANAYSYLGYCYYQLENYTSSETTLKKALEMNPFDVIAARNYACLLHKLGRIDEAYDLVREILQKAPNNQEFKKLLQEIKERNVDEVTL